MERGEIQLILQEQQFQMSGACDDAVKKLKLHHSM